MNIQIPRWVQLVGLPIMVLLLWFSAAHVTHAIYLFVSAMVIALILNPLIKKLEWLKIPRYIGVLFVYLALLGLMVMLLVLVIPPAIGQLEEILNNSPQYAETVREQIESWQDTINRLNLPFDLGDYTTQVAQRVEEYIADIGSQLLTYSVNFVGALTNFFIVLVISIYMLLDAKRIGLFVHRLFPEKFGGDADEFILRSQRAVTQWVRAQVLLGLLIGASTALGIWLLGVVGIWPEGSKYSIFFGAWAGVTEFIPYVGPILGAIPPVLVALFASPWSALGVVVLFIVIQQLEGHVLVPNVMSSIVGVHPLVVIFAVLAGAEFRGITGMILALPLVALGREMYCFFKPRVSFEKWYREAPENPPADGGDRPATEEA
ncbi:MAG: AI-2E family transporter [Thermoleophilia bacterium]